jgi:hypothetical protein
MWPSPGLVLALVLVAIATQVAWVLVPRGGPYAWRLLLSVAGLMAGEMFASGGHLAIPSVGVLHPLADLLGIAALQGVGWLLVGGADAGTHRHEGS